MGALPFPSHLFPNSCALPINNQKLTSVKKEKEELMATPEHVTIERVGWKYGLFLAAGNIGYFLLMAAFGLETETWLRVGNFILMFALIYTSIRTFKHKNYANFTYLKGLAEGIYTVLVGYVPFAIFIFIYAAWIDEDFTYSMTDMIPLGQNFLPLVIGFVTLLEGMIYGVIFSFTMMQRLKITHFKHPTRK